jgi:hypothetical protein
MALGDLTTLANVKEWLPIPATTTTEDDTLTRLITATSSDFVRATKRPDLLSQSYAEVHQGDGGTRMIAFHWPITAIASLSVAGAAVPESADKIQPGWYIDEDIDPERVWNVYLNNYVFSDGAPIALNYTAGYATVPSDIEQAVIDWIVYRYKGRPTVGQTMRRVEGDSVHVQEVDAPLTTQSVIEKYTRCFPSLDRREAREEMRQKSAAKGKHA